MTNNDNTVNSLIAFWISKSSKLNIYMSSYVKLSMMKDLGLNGRR